MKILSRNTYIALFVILMIVFTLSCYAQKGDGSEKNPFVITSAQELLDFANKVNEGNAFKGKYFVLKNDIDLSTICGENKGNWIPIGTVIYDDSSVEEIEEFNGNAFEGSFDGNNKQIKNLYINSESDFQALFGFNKGIIKNLTITGEVFGKSFVSGICAENSKGKIENCHNLCVVDGENSIGGICGDNFQGIITNCSNENNIFGTENAGGICGYNSKGKIAKSYNNGNVNGNRGIFIGGICRTNEEEGKIENCYNAGNVIGINFVDGICYNDGMVKNCYDIGYTIGDWSDGEGTRENYYYIIEKNIYDYEIKLMGEAPINILDEAHFEIQESFKNWDFKNVWEINKKFNRPTLRENPETNTTINSSRNFSGGNGTEEKPYIISTAQDLIVLVHRIKHSFEYFEDKFFIVSKDIDLSSMCGSKKGSRFSIGGATIINGKLIYYPFKGTFDGNGHKITGLYIKNEEDCIGLFGWNEGIIKNLTVSGYVDSTGKYIGGICGYNNSGTIWNCKNLCTITAHKDVGGVCGYNENGLIALCSNIVDVLGDENVGGICGDNSHGIIRECFNVGNIVAEEDSGGICGSNSDVLINCYNIGNVSGINDVAGICNNLLFSKVTACYNMGKIKGEDFIGGIVGNRSGSVSSCYYQVGKAKGGMNSKDYVGQVDALDENQFFNKSSFKMWDFDSIWEMSDSLKRPILRSNKEK